MPAVVCGLLLAIVRLVRLRLPAIQRAVAVGAVICIPLSVVVGTIWLEHVNESRYGLAITNVEQTSMSAGLGPMFRVAPATTFDQFPVTLETRELLYGVSPHFAELRDEIENGVGDALLHHSTRRRARPRWTGLPMGRARCDRHDRGHAYFCGRTRRHVPLDCRRDRHRPVPTGDSVRCHHTVGLPRRGSGTGLPGLMARSVTGLRKTVDLSAFSALSPDGDGTTADRALFDPDDQRAVRSWPERLLHAPAGSPDQRRPLALPVARGRRARRCRVAGSVGADRSAVSVVDDDHGASALAHCWCWSG